VNHGSKHLLQVPLEVLAPGKQLCCWPALG